MGNYRYLMIYFSVFAMFFSILDVILRPFILAHGTICSFFLRRSESDFVAGIQYVLLIGLCSCFGVTITFFAIHFAFRYFALERKGRISYFDGFYILIWIALPIICGLLWGLTLHLFTSPNEETTELLRETILDHYNMTMDEVVYLGASYWRVRKDGTMEMIVTSFVTGAALQTFMIITFSTVCYYGYLSHRRIAELPQEGESAFTRNLQKQLYKALVIQTLIPVFIMYLPIGTFILLPAFNVNIESFSKLATIFYAIYPAVDPLPLFFIIDNYRIALKSFFYRCGKNRVSNGEDETA